MAGPSAIRGKVVLVPFPFGDRSGSKVRPTVRLTEPVGPHHHVVLAFVTGQAEPASRRAGAAALLRSQRVPRATGAGVC
jgi:hypothetical protein